MKPQLSRAAVPIFRLTDRSQFLAAKNGTRGSVPGLVVQALKVPGQAGVAMGFTTSSKTVGNAVQRNRARRRLKAVTDAAIRLNPAWNISGYWLVFIARPECLTCSYEELQAHLQKALAKAGVV